MLRLAGEAVVETMEIVELDSSLTKEEILLAQQEDETIQKNCRTITKSRCNLSNNGSNERLFRLERRIIYR